MAARSASTCCDGRGAVERQAVPAHAVRKVGAAARAVGLRPADELGMGLLRRRILLVVVALKGEVVQDEPVDSNETAQFLFVAGRPDERP
jgi:hypothetical protein